MRNGHLYLEDTYDEIYHQMLKDVYAAPNHEVVGLSYTLKYPESLGIKSDTRAFDLDNAEKFYQWILSGSKDMTSMKKLTKRAVQFDREIEGRNPHYGPRIVEQIDDMIDELVARPDSRRACIMILDSKDQVFLPPKREDKNTIEYPCTIMLNYFIRNGYLHSNVTMRSNNVCSTICYDNYIFCRLQQHVVDEINKRIDFKVYLGWYFHYIVNAHIIRGEVKRSREILEERYGEVGKLAKLQGKNV